MSYSFSVRAASKADAKVAVAIKFDEVVASQASHARDRKQAVAAASAFIDLLPDDPTHDVIVSMYGSLSGDWSTGDLTSVTAASVNVAASLAAKAL